MIIYNSLSLLTSIRLIQGTTKCNSKLTRGIKSDRNTPLFKSIHILYCTCLAQHYCIFFSYLPPALATSNFHLNSVEFCSGDYGLVIVIHKVYRILKLLF